MGPGVPIKPFPFVEDLIVEGFRVGSLFGIVEELATTLLVVDFLGFAVEMDALLPPIALLESLAGRMPLLRIFFGFLAAGFDFTCGR